MISLLEEAIILNDKGLILCTALQLKNLVVLKSRLVT